MTSPVNAALVAGAADSNSGEDHDTCRDQVS